MKAVEFINVSKSFSGIRIVSNITLTIDSGASLGILGPVGSGKSTLLQLSIGLLSPEHGTVRIFGSDMSERPVIALSRINFASGSGRLSGYASIHENLLTYCRLYSVSNYRHVIKFFTKLLGIEHLMASGVKVYRLSAGENAKVNICKALLTSPDILFLDEVTSHLDIPSKENLFRYLRDCQKKSRLSIVFASQQLEDVRAICSQVIVLKSGRIIYRGKNTDNHRLTSYYA